MHKISIRENNLFDFLLSQFQCFIFKTFYSKYPNFYQGSLFYHYFQAICFLYHKYHSKAHQKQMTDQIKPLLNQPKYKSQALVVKVLLNIAISSLLIGYYNTYFNAIDYDDFTRIFGINQYKSFYQGLLIGLITLTSSIGGFVASFMLSKMSRINCFLLVNVISIFVTLALMIKNIQILMICRLIQGCICGISTSLVPLYIKQFSPLELTGKVGAFHQMMIVAGCSISFFVSYVCSLFFSAQFYWRVVFIFPLFLIVYQTYNLVYIYPFNTPKYLLSCEKNEEAKELLNIIYKEEYVEERLLQLKKMFAFSSNKIIQLQDLNKNGAKEIKKPEQVQQIKYHNNKLAVYAAIHISTLQQLSGISIVVGYGAEIVKRVFPSLAKILPIFLHFEAVLACFLAIELLKTYGRKTISQLGSLGCGLFTLLLGYKIAQIGNQVAPIGTGLLVLIALFAYRFIYGFTIGPVAFMYVPEIVEPNIMPYIIVIYWMCPTALVMLFPILKEFVFDNNPGPMFAIFGCYTLFSLIINHFVLVETKGKKEFEVRMEYDRLLGIEHKDNPQDTFSRIKL